MAIVNRTPDSFYDKGATYAADAGARPPSTRAVADGAAIVDIGGVKAGPGADVDAAEELRRTASFVATVRARHPDVVISVDTWRAEVGAGRCVAGADLLNDAWGGVDPGLAEVAAEYGAGLVCTHAGGAAAAHPPAPGRRTTTWSPTCSRVPSAMPSGRSRWASGATAVLLDPGHDFGKNTRHSLEATRRLPSWSRPAGRCWCRCRQGLRRRDAGRPAQRAAGGHARHDLGVGVARRPGVPSARRAETRQTLDMVASIAGRRPPGRRPARPGLSAG